MKRIVMSVCLLTVCLLCGANEITIRPQFAAGDTVRYRTTTHLILYHGEDSLVSTTKMLPEIMVEERTEDGFIIKTTNRLEDFSVVCSDPEADEELTLFDQSGILTDVAVATCMRIRLGADGRPDSVLNMDEVREAMVNAYVAMFMRQQGADVADSAEWEMDTKPLIVGAVNMLCTPKHMIEQQFGNVPYFNFIGVPLKSGRIPSSMVLAGDLQKMCYGLSELEMEIKQVVNTTELNIGEDDGVYVIRIKGANEKTSVEGELLYLRGILSQGSLSMTVESYGERILSRFTISEIR